MHSALKIAGIRCSVELGSYWSIDLLTKTLESLSSKSAQTKMAEWARLLRGTPFVFESNLPLLPRDVLRVRLSSLDCVTYVYTVMALSLANTIEGFVTTLLRLRYLLRDGRYSFDSTPTCGNIIDFCEEVFFAQHSKRDFVIQDITNDAFPTKLTMTVSMPLKPFGRVTCDGSPQIVSPKFLTGVVASNFIPSQLCGQIDPRVIESGDIVLFTRGPSSNSGEEYVCMISHLAIVEKVDQSLYFWHATRHYQVGSARSGRSTGVFYEPTQTREQIGVAICGEYEGEQYDMDCTHPEVFGELGPIEIEPLKASLLGRLCRMHPSKPRTLADYARSNFIGIKILRLIAPA